MNRFGYLDAELFTNKCCYIGLLLYIEQNMNYPLTFSVFILMRKLSHNLFCFLTSHNTSNIQEKKNTNTISVLHQREKNLQD